MYIYMKESCHTYEEVTAHHAHTHVADALHWLGITKIDHLISMSDMKYNAITGSGIKVHQHTATHCNTLQHTATHCNT